VFRAYSVLPLFAVVLAMPYRTLKVDSRLLAAGVAVLITCDVGVSVIRYAQVAATWAARDPIPLDEFFGRYVPVGSAVMGPAAEPYFMAIEHANARYLSVSAASFADWARWVPTLEPEATTAHRLAVPRPRTRFLVWPIDDDLPDGYGCAREHVVAAYVPAPTHLDRLGPFGTLTQDVGYHKSVLYRLPPDCPTGYDPSGGHSSSN
jgi:hypothetical protein